MLKIVTVIGARPQIIKAAALSRAIATHFQSQIKEVIVHTGQHYDANMSQVFIDELSIPAPDYNLNIGSASHGVQTAGMIEGIEKILQQENPNYLVLYGDTNSTLAGAIAAAKIHIPIIHIEAGLRSFNKSMPEEINRIMCDHASTLLFSPTKTGLDNLMKEGFSDKNNRPFSVDNPGIFHCGDVMFDNSLFFEKIAETKSEVLEKYDLKGKSFVLGTIHRDNNTDQPDRLNAIFRALNSISKENKILVVLPLHPRTSKKLGLVLEKGLFNEIQKNTFFKLLPPVSFLDMIQLESNCQLVITDSGGVQKEAYFFEKPSIILRSETEWVEIVEQGCGIIANADEDKIASSYSSLIKNKTLLFPPLFGDGKAAEFICRTMIENA